MLSTVTPPGARRVPHCRTCGKPMKGHKNLECQLRSPSAEADKSSTYDGSQSYSEMGTPPPQSPLDRHHSRDSSVFSGRSSGLQTTHSHQPQTPRKVYTPNPIPPSPSWTLPPTGVVYHRVNPYVEHPAAAAHSSPLRRNASWATTVPADDNHTSSGYSTPTQSFYGQKGDSMASSMSELARELETSLSRESSGSPTPSAPDSFYAPSSRRSSARGDAPIIVDSLGNKVSGVDISTLGDNIKGVLRQAEECGFMAAVVRPPLGYKRGAIDVRTNTDADRLTTVFVATGPDTMSINMVYSDTLRRTKLMNDEFAGNLKVQGARFWAIIFMVVFTATVVGGFVNKSFL